MTSTTPFHHTVLQDLDDIRCVACGESRVAPNSSLRPSDYACQARGATYDLVFGVPFFGQFEAEDILGLIEIAANFGNRGKFGVTPAAVEDWERLLGAYHEALDKAEFVRNHSAAQSPFLANRYGEWVEFIALTRDVDLRGRKVLDVRAGLGFDSHRLALRGASVTALEFFTPLAEWGTANFPHILWVGGFSHCLPFASGSFDAVFCNAALHHMRDIPSAVSEALRVLWPGGLLITTCDSFRSDSSPDDAELRILDGGPSVLHGVTEGVPHFREFIAALQRYPALLDVELFTHTLFRCPLTELTPWTIADSAMLAQSKGSLAMRVRLKAPWPEAARLQVGGVLTARHYGSWLTAELAAVAKLAALIPERYVDLPFSGHRNSKFELLNGWRRRWLGGSRTGFRRGRWFLRRPRSAAALACELQLPSAAGGKRSITFLPRQRNGERHTEHRSYRLDSRDCGL